MMSHAAPAVNVQDARVAFGRIQALRGIDLQVPAGVSFGLLGPNGSGKTTLIKLLTGLIRPQSGLVQVLGEPPSPHIAGRLGYMPQLSALYLELSPAENIGFFAQVYGLAHKSERDAAVAAVLKLIGLWERRNDPVLQLSGGMRQRVSLACALVHRPALLFLDEPTVGLDPELRAAFWEHFRNLTREGVTIVVSSHTMDDAAHCDLLAFLREGRVIAQGSPNDLRAAVGTKDASLEDAFLHFARQGSAASVS